MKTTYKTKELQTEETKVVSNTEKKKQKFFFPTHNISVEASSYDCAMRKLEDLGFVDTKTPTPCEDKR